MIRDAGFVLEGADGESVVDEPLVQELLEQSPGVVLPMYLGA
jgi:hypothetical protein